MTTEKLAKILSAHKAWLADDPSGKRANLHSANLSGADLSSANLHSANLRGANLRGADLSEANLSGADLSEANLRSANLSSANLRGANLRGADLSGADLSGADLSEADLRWANLRSANLSGANLHSANLRYANLRGANLSGAYLNGAYLSSAELSGAKNLLSAVNYIDAHYERTADGYIAYKTFGGQHAPPDSWEIKTGAVITEIVNFDRCTECGSGINVAPLEWVRGHYKGDIWKVLIRWEWLAGVCVPYMTDGKIRCEKVELLEIVL